VRVAFCLGPFGPFVNSLFEFESLILEAKGERGVERPDSPRSQSAAKAVSDKPSIEMRRRVNVWTAGDCSVLLCITCGMQLLVPFDGGGSRVCERGLALLSERLAADSNFSKLMSS
jgi:hypothetical protein